MFYSPNTGGFYASNAPADSVEISDVRHAELLAGEVNGRRIVPGEGGFPQLSEASAAIRVFTPLEFLDLFPEPVQLAVVQATLSSAEVKRWYDRVLASTYITRDDPRVDAGLAALVGGGLLTEQDRAAVLAAMGGQ